MTYARSEKPTGGAPVADVLVDTSVWVDFFRRSAQSPWRPRLVDLLERGAVAIVDPVVAELLYGARSEREQTVIRQLGESVRRPPLGLEVWLAAGKLGHQWRARGVTLALVDCVLAAVAHRESLALWTLDEEFAPLFAAGTIARFDPAGP